MIVGTAGHIDHGKTSLVRALTGIDTDRLKEEKARGISIDLGFAYIPLPGGEVLGFVDVPGHERLVHTMIAGAASIDLALLVVASDDGVMPQTCEHLQILQMLGIGSGLVALTKTDLVAAERALEVELEISALLEGTKLAGTEVFPVSCASGAGIEALRQRLLAEATRERPRAVGGAFRFTVDRSFSLAGAGTVVTGSIVAGEVRVGDTVLVLPGGQPARVRSLHAGNQPAERGVAGQRCALNLTGPGIRKDGIGRGDWVMDLAQDGMSQRCDVILQLLASERASLKHWTPVQLHHGASQVAARVVVLEPQLLGPGESGLAQLILDQPRPLRHGDRFVLRDTSAQRTIAGGRALDPRAPERHRRRPARLALLRALQAEPQAEALRRALALPPYLRHRGELLMDWGLNEAALDAVIPGLCRLTSAKADYVATTEIFTQLSLEIAAALEAFHTKQPAAVGMAPEALRLALPARLPRDAFGALLAHAVAAGDVVSEAHLVRAPAHRARLAGTEAQFWAQLQPLLAAAPYKPPRLRDLAKATGIPEVALRRFCKQFSRAGRLMEPVPDQFFLRDAVIKMAQAAQALSAETADAFTAAQFRDRLGNGRQLAVEVLEYFDRRGLTVRRGDLRRVIKDPTAVFGAAGASD